VESESDSALRLRTVFGSVSIKLEHLRKVAVLTTRGGRWTRAPDLSRGDLIRLASGEEDVGMVERIGENDIGFRSSILKERLNYPVRDVSEIHFQPVGGRTTFEASRAFASVGLADGSSLRGNLRELSPSGVKLEAEIGSIGDPSFPISLVASITLHNGSLAYLSDIAPASALEKPYVGVGPMLFPYQRDRSVAGDDRPLSVAGTRYPKGLGVHAHSELTYALDGKFGTFQAIAGLDDSAGGKGSVVFKVIGDGKVLFDSGVIAGRAWAEGLGAGSAPKEIRLDVRGVQKLTLRVESGPDDDVQDRAAWADAKLIR
ncbi:MAG TPA: NPCBM/NEW2 domain-containing protein, partial [Planctomycetota bacterium]|nr:NPCBM/NEW2 domain-containing protein [Planctomycetota bacterium]